MADIVCVEPALSLANSVVEVANNDTLVFPHVDSCMSVTLFLPPDTLVGGHAGMMDTTTFEMNAPVLLASMVTRMLTRAGTRKITRAVFAGNANPNAAGGENWRVGTQIARLRQVTGNPNLPCPLINSWDSARGIDVFFENGPTRLKVQLYQFEANRADLGVPTRRASVLDVPYHAIRDVEVK